MKKKVFISFDYDHDLELKNGLVGQAENLNSQFSFNDMSIQQEIDIKWKSAARQKIKQCDVVIVICGEYTDSARGVTAELTIAKEEGIPYFLLWGRPNKEVREPLGINSSDKIYKWAWDNLKALISGRR